MHIRRSLATALAAGTLVLGFGLATPAAHAVSPGPDVVKISPCIIDPDSCAPHPGPTVPKGPGDLTIDPCTVITHGDCDSDPTPHDGPDDLTTPTTDPDGPSDPNPGLDDADPATVVHATATFTG